MKRETTLKIGLRLLGLAFSIGPLLIAFSINDWDIQRTMVNAAEIESIENQIRGLFEQEAGGFEIGEAEYDNTSHLLRLPVTLSLPFPFSIDLVGFDITAQFDSQQVTLSMEQDSVTLSPNENAVVWLSGQVADETLVNTQPTNIQGSLTLQKYGVSINVKFTAQESEGR